MVLVDSVDADASLNESFNLQWNTVSLGLSNEVLINLEDSQLHDLFNGKICQSFVVQVSYELWGNFEDLHFDETLKGLILKAHLMYLRDESGIDLEDPRFHQVFHPEIETTGLHFTHEV